MENTIVSNVGPFIGFCPSPDCTYIIEPNSTYYVVKGNFDQGQLVSDDMKPPNNTMVVCKVQFAPSRPTVAVTESSRGQLALSV
ncbi:hypothetical protein BX600DRAFT_477293 [Xylariales sp. PMI_506]|nr:hypothetical protein BX600DRAFT_477293 [Xylariales sp. PMI_506]